MTALANSLQRIWSAMNGVPHQTRWGTPGSQPLAEGGLTLVGLAVEKYLELVELAQRTAPSIIAFTLNIFR